MLFYFFHFYWKKRKYSSILRTVFCVLIISRKCLPCQSFSRPFHSCNITFLLFFLIKFSRIQTPTCLDLSPGSLTFHELPFLLFSSAGSATEINYHVADFYFWDRRSKKTHIFFSSSTWKVSYLNVYLVTRQSAFSALLFLCGVFFPTPVKCQQ